MDWCSANGRDRSPSAPLPILVNLGFWLTEQKLIHNLVLFVYPPARPNKSVAALTHTVSSGLFRCYFSLLKESSFFTSSLYSTLKLLKTHFASFPLQLLSAMPSVFFFLFFFAVLAVHPLSLFTVCPLPLRPTISPSQLSVCFSPRFVILSYQLLLVPQSFLHLTSA